MKFIFTCAVLCCALLWCAWPGHAHGQVFLEQDGVLMMEIESAPVAKGWTVKTELPGFTGKSYVKHASNGGEMHYKFFIMHPGTYHFRLHSHNVHPDKTEDNDCWVSLNGGPKVKLFSYVRAKWTYVSMHEFSHSNKVHAKYDLPMGEHVITISGRSPNFMIDHLLLYRTNKKKVENRKVPESVMVGGVDYRKITHLKKAASALKSGRFGSAWKVADEAMKDADTTPEAKAEAQVIITGVTKYVTDFQTNLETWKQTAPALATTHMKALGKAMKSSPWAEDIEAKAKAWGREPATKTDQKAESLLRKALAAEKELAKRLRGAKVKDETEAKRFAKYIKPLLQISAQLDKSYAGSRAQGEAVKILERHGIAHLKQ